MTSHKKLFAVAGAIFAALLLSIGLRSCISKPSGPTDQLELLKPGEVERIETSGRTLTVTTSKGVVEHYVPDTATVVVRSNGDVDVDIDHTGFEYELGGGVGFTVGLHQRLKLTIDSRIAYAWRLSLHGGLTLDPAADKLINFARPLLFVAYPLPWDVVPNTSIWVGHELPGDWIGGVRVRF